MLYKILFPLFLLLFIQCKESEMIQLAYSETQCADAWECNCNEDAEIAAAVSDFLKDNTSGNFDNVIVDSSNIDLIHCHACDCPSGRTIFIDVEEKDLDEFLDLGFNQI